MSRCFAIFHRLNIVLGVEFEGHRLVVERITLFDFPVVQLVDECVLIAVAVFVNGGVNGFIKAALLQRGVVRIDVQLPIGMFVVSIILRIVLVVGFNGSRGNTIDVGLIIDRFLHDRHPLLFGQGVPIFPGFLEVRVIFHFLDHLFLIRRVDLFEVRIEKPFRK